MASKSITLATKDGKTVTVHSKKKEPVVTVTAKEEEDLDIEPEVEPVSSLRKQKRAAPEKSGKSLGIVATAVGKALAEPEKKKAPAKKAKKEPEAKAKEKEPSPSPEPVEEEDDEPIPAVAAVPVPEKKEKKEVKVSNKGIPKGGRFDTVPLYKKNNKTGKAKTGEVARRESRYLQTTNGLLLKTTFIKRVTKNSAMTKALPILEKEAIPQIARLKARGKPVPHNLQLCLNKKQRSISSGASKLILAIAETDLAQKFEVANTYQVHAGNRQTMFHLDFMAAIQRLA
jgi:hypothetical protein